MSSILDSPPRLTGLVLGLLLVSGLGWTFGPRQFGLLFLVMGFLILSVGGTATLVVPRRRAAARLAIDRSTPLPAPTARAGTMRRMWWWNLTWRIGSSLSPDEIRARITSVIEARKASAEWPFGDTTTKLHIEGDGFATAPGWLWNAPYKPLLSGWVEPSSSGGVYAIKLGMAYDPPFEVMFVIVGAIVAVGGIGAFLQQGSTSNWQFLPLVLLPLAFIFAVGQLGRWRLRRAGARLVTDATAAVSGEIIAAWPGWR